MTIRIKMLLTIGALALSAAPQAAAQQIELFTGFSAANMKPEQAVEGLTMKGWNTSITAYPTSRFGFTADFAGLYGDKPVTIGNTAYNVDFRQYSFLAGPQIRVLRKHAFETSFKALVGAARGYASDSAANSSYELTDTKLAALIGGNLDINVSKRVALRFSSGVYLTTFNDEVQKNFRFSIGPVLRFGGSDH